jgi:hypothetical protein
VVVAGAVEEERGREEREETRLSRDRVSPTPGTQHKPGGAWANYLERHQTLNVVFTGVHRLEIVY